MKNKYRKQILLTLALTFTLAACGGNETPSTTQGSSNPSSSSSASPSDTNSSFSTVNSASQGPLVILTMQTSSARNETMTALVERVLLSQSQALGFQIPMERQFSINQLMTVANCRRLNVECLQHIADDHLQIPQFLFASVSSVRFHHRRHSRSALRYSLELNLYNRSLNQMLSERSTALSGTQIQDEAILISTIHDLLQRLMNRKAQLEHPSVDR